MYYNGYLLLLKHNCTLEEIPLPDSLPDDICAILRHIDTPEQFCLSHELVNKFRITTNSRRMLKEARFSRLRSFRFFLCKN